MEAIILAGGFGTRLKKVVKDIPKPMADVNGEPFLSYLFSYLKSFGIKRVILSTSYKSNIISNYFKNSYQGIEVDYAVENEPLGTGGGILYSLKKIKSENALVLNGDTLFDIDINNFNKKHKQSNSFFSLALRKVDDVSRYGSVITNENNIITEFAEKGKYNGKGFINGGVYIINKKEMLKFALKQKFSLEKDFFEKYYKKHNLFGFKYNNYFIDIGIPEDYYKAQNDFKKLKY